MQKAEAQHNHAQSQPAQRQGGVAALESPQGERIAQLEAMAESSPQAAKLAQLAAMANNSSRISAQRKAISVIHNSPNLTAQRQQLDSLTGGTAQSAQAPALPSTPIQLSGREGDEWGQGPGQGEQAPPTPRPLQGGQIPPPLPEAESLIQDGYSPRAGEERDETAQLVAADESSQLKVTQCADALVKPNNTGLPDNLKSGIESLSGMSMDNVKVHYNSSQPAQLNALAYAQGTDIHVAPGQEQHLPHEAWHVVQQAQGRVKPTMQMKEGVPVNDDEGLEHEADVMGAKALMQKKMNSGKEMQTRCASQSSTEKIFQRQLMADVQRLHDTPQEAVEVADLGYGGAVTMTEYAQLLKDDASVIVKPNNAVTPAQKGYKVKEKLENAALDGRELKAAFVEKLVAGGDWLNADGDTLAGIKEKMQAILNETNLIGGDPMYDLSGDDWGDVSVAPSDYGLDMANIVSEQIGTDMDGIDKAGGLSGLGDYSDEWKLVLAFVAYELVKDSFYPVEVGEVDRPLLPFIKLINDINDESIEGLTYVRKYNSAAGLGAEFRVVAPADKRDEYDNKAVVHTHYAKVDEQPNYGHTKPYANRFAGGYGYTKVEVDKINSIDDTQKEYRSL